METWWWERLHKGQVSLEAITAIIIIVLTLLVVVTQNNLRLEQNEFLEKTELQRAECTHLQSAITLVQSNKENSQIELEMKSDANISKNFVNFQYYQCEFIGTHSYTELSKGNIRISQLNEVLVFENF